MFDFFRHVLEQQCQQSISALFGFASFAAAVAAAVALVRSGLCVRPRFVTVDGGDDVMAGRVDDAIEGGITGITEITGTRGGDRAQMAERRQYATNVPEQGVLVDQT